MKITTIADAQDPLVGDYVNVREADLVRRRGIFLAEGTEVVRTLLRSPHEVRSVFLLDKRLEEMRAALETRPDLPVFITTSAVMNEVVGFDIHRGCLAAGARREISNPLEGRRLLLLESLANHDNVGASFRNAAAFGVDGVVLDGRCADPLYRKAIRTSMGHALTTPFVRVDDWAATLDRLATDGFEIVALDPAAETTLDAFARMERSGRLALILGTEGRGLSPVSRAKATHHVRIEMAKGVDSLNVATAGAIALYELFR